MAYHQSSLLSNAGDRAAVELKAQARHSCIKNGPRHVHPNGESGMTDDMALDSE